MTQGAKAAVRVPYLMERMEKDENLNFMLAYAVIEILGWKRSDFSAGSEQEFRDQVLQRMRTEKSEDL